MLIRAHVPGYGRHFAQHRRDLVAFDGIMQALYVAWQPFDGPCLGSTLTTELGLSSDWAMVVVHVEVDNVGGGIVLKRVSCSCPIDLAWHLSVAGVWQRLVAGSKARCHYCHQPVCKVRRNN